MNEIAFVRPVLSDELVGEIQLIKETYDIRQDVPNLALPIVSRYMFNKKIRAGVSEPRQFADDFIGVAESLQAEGRMAQMGRIALFGNAYTPNTIGFKVDKFTAEDILRDRLVIAHEVGFKLTRDEKSLSDVYLPVFTTGMKQEQRVKPARAKELISDYNAQKGNRLTSAKVSPQEVILK